MSTLVLPLSNRLLPRLRQTLRTCLAAAGMALALVAAPVSQAATLDELLAYDASQPLNLRVIGREHRLGAWIEDVTYDSVAGAPPVAAYIVRPARAQPPYAGVVFGHWFEPSSSTSNRTQFVDEAVRLAQLGVVSVLPATLWSDPYWFDQRSWRNDFQGTLNQAKDFRRAIDIVLAQSGVDNTRIAFVGHDFSAMHGALISAVETRVKGFALIAGTSRWADWYLYGAADGVPTGSELTDYLAQLAQIDPITAVALTHAKLLVQMGEDDFYTPRPNFAAFHAVTPAQTSRLTTYEAQHPMDAPVIRLDRDLWLRALLGLTKTTP